MANDPFETPAVQPGRDAAQRSTSDASRQARRADHAGASSAESISRNPETEKDSGEKVRISQAARELLRQSELMDRARQSLSGASDVRSERVKEVKERLEAGVYETNAVRDELAERLTHILGDLPYRGSDDSER